MEKELTIESADLEKISNFEINQIFEIEQDTWAYSIWEYVKCNNCWKIHSKKDIFWYLPKDIFFEVVAKIEDIIWIDSIKCLNCWSDCEHIFWKEYISDIVDRYKNQLDSILVLYRETNWNILWFMDWYINNFDTIFEKEYFYYEQLWKNYIKMLIENLLSEEINWNILMMSALWVKKELTNYDTILKIKKHFFAQISTCKTKFDFSTFELRLWSLVHEIYQNLWAIWLWIPENNSNYKKVSFINPNSQSDIFIHTDIVWASKLL